jgi:hypothetical protein
MDANRLKKSVVVLTAAVMMILPASVSAAAIVRSDPSATRSAYYNVKERQFDRFEKASARTALRRDRSHRAPSGYAQFKDKQMERFLNGE